jgi:beta-aspartyl-peptidase (threonine type)
MQYEHKPIQLAAETALNNAKQLGGNGGLIALDKDGNFAMLFNTTGMYRGFIDSEGKTHVAIYR